MGINPDAYMSGAIPGLSRGGSWQNIQDPCPSPHDQTQQGGGSIYPRPSQIVPPGSAGSTVPGMGNRSHSHFAHHHQHHQHQHPWAMTALPQSPLSNGFAPSYQQSYFGVGSQGSSTGYSPSGKAPSVGPTRHPGWTNLNGQYIGVHTAPSSPTVKHSQTPPRSTTSKHPPPSVRTAQLQSPSSAGGLSIQQQYEWEWASGSPKPMTAEADYFGQSPIQNEKYKPMPAHDITPPPSARVMTLRLPPKKTKTVEALPPPPQSGRLRHESMRQTQSQRPTPQRRHTHDRFSPEDPEIQISKQNSKSLGRQRRKERDNGSVAGESYYAPSKSSSMPKHQIQAPQSHSPRGGSRRTESLLSTQARATSLTERRLRQTGRPALPTIVSNSTVDFTSPDPSVAQSARPDRPPFDLGDMVDALPPAPITATPAYTAMTGSYAPTKEEEEDYDRYMAHPAAPSPLPGTARKTEPPLRMDLKIVKPEDYRPPAFPAPTKPLAWNRDGPAMKTHGVAWAREAPEGQLPTGPAGPRWAQARPPRLDFQRTGNWWESGVG
jgi:hypothetical protein